MNFRKKTLFVTLTILGCAAALVFVMINNLSLAQAKESIPTFQVAQARQRERSREYPFPHIRINGQVEPTRTDSSPSPDRIAFPTISVPNFDTTIVKRPLKIRVYDTGAQDGDVIRISLNNGAFLRDVTLTSAGTIVEFPSPPLRASVNRIEFIALSEGSSPPLTLGMSYAADQVVQKQTMAMTKDLVVGETFSTSVGFPQIALCLSIIRFPCRGQQSQFQSATHVLESIGIPPEPITAPLRPGFIGNTPRPFYPRLLTLDRNIQSVVDSRRDASVLAYECLDPATQDRDEYPPAAFKENEGSAHIKCIDRSDNRGAGASFGNQLNFYRIREGDPPQPRLDDGDTIEFVVLL
jgi:hypothetical protein